MEQTAYNEFGRILFVDAYDEQGTPPFSSPADLEAIIAQVPPRPELPATITSYLSRFATTVTTPSFQAWDDLPLYSQVAFISAIEIKLSDRPGTAAQVIGRLAAAGTKTRNFSETGKILFERRYPECATRFGDQPLFLDRYELTARVGAGPQHKKFAKAHNVILRTLGQIERGQKIASQPLLSVLQKALHTKYPAQADFVTGVMEQLSMATATRNGNIPKPSKVEQILLWQRYPQCADDFGPQTLFSSIAELKRYVAEVPLGPGEPPVVNQIDNILLNRPAWSTTVPAVTAAIKKKYPQDQGFVAQIAAELTQHIQTKEFADQTANRAAKAERHAAAKTALHGMGFNDGELRTPIVTELKKVSKALNDLQDLGVDLAGIRRANLQRLRTALDNLVS